MSTANQLANKKRKATDSAQLASSSTRKRQKFQDARTISTQTADAALSKTGELNITSFIRAREYEINALDRSMKRAKQSLSTRAFQQVPRHLRRRTASHNAKKVPRRIRARARREMIEDNTPTVNSKTRSPTSRLRLRLETAKALKKLTQKRKTARQKKREAKISAINSDPAKHVEIVRPPRIRKNVMAKPPLATSKFKRRQVHKTWLPTHLWHTKRAHMPKPTEPLWRMAIPLRPTEKCYRATHRVSESRGCIAWDTSYMSTIACRGTSTALEGLLKALSFHGHAWSGSKYQRWKSGSRFASGWTCMRVNKEALAEIDVIWCARNVRTQTTETETVEHKQNIQGIEEPPTPKRKKAKLDYRLMIRIHPAAFKQFWIELLQAAKSQKPQVLVEDLRFEIGSIEIIGPASTEALTSALKLAHADTSAQKLWKTLSVLTNPALLPADVTVSIKIQDPRLTRASNPPSALKDDAVQTSLHDLIVDWPLDTRCQPSPLFSNKARYLASKLPSQWALNRRRQAILPGQTLPLTDKDPSIPVMLLAQRPKSAGTTQQGRWILLAPWKCVDVIWRKLLFVPLSSGGRPRFGGLREKQQVDFEQGVPWFPADFPGTAGGKAWEGSQTEKRFDEWLRQPPSRRIAWEKLDLGLDRRGELGRGWACDWEYLLRDTIPKVRPTESTSGPNLVKAEEAISTQQPLLTQRQRKAAQKAEEARTKVETETGVDSGEQQGEDSSSLLKDVQYVHLSPLAAKRILSSTQVQTILSKPALMTVKITLIGRGTPRDAARIYRLPSSQGSDSRHAIVGSDPDKSDNPLPSNSAPAASRPTPPSQARGSSDTSAKRGLELRRRWLSLDIHPNLSGPQPKTRKDKTNHRGLPKKAGHHVAESMRHINVLPKNAPPSVHEQYGPKPLSEEEKLAILHHDLAVRMEEEKVWDVHVPCPDPEDLLGFVTSGGYNLSEGTGTAIGSIWVQRLLDGWNTTESYHDHDHDRQQQMAPGSGSVQVQKNKSIKKGGKVVADQRQRDRERRLCIVRNAGESVGRLAVWELC